MKKTALLLVGLAVFFCFSCGKASPPPATEVIVYPGNSEEKEYLIAEIELPNCGNPAPVTHTIEETISSGETLKLSEEITVQAGGSAQIPGIGGVNVGAEIARQVGTDYSKIESRTRSLVLTADPGTHMSFNVIRHDEIQRGRLVIRAEATEYETDYELIARFWLESKPEDLGCPDITPDKKVVEAEVDKITISPGSLTLEKTERRQLDQLDLKVFDTNGEEVVNPKVFWDSLNPLVADVVGGWVIGYKEGMAEITASVEEVEASVIVDVVKQSVHSVSVIPENITLEVGDKERCSATVLDPRGNEIIDRSVSWSSDNPSVAEVEQDGMVTW
jgi:hypothetical protein